MRSFKKLVLLELILIGSAASAFAASDFSIYSSSHALTWQDCVKIALKDNPDLAAAKKAIDSARASYYASWNEVLPSLSSLEDGYTKVRSANQSSFLASNGVAGGGFQPWTIQGDAHMDIFNFKDSQDIRKAHAFVSQMWSSYRVSSVTVRYNLKVAFYRLLFAYKMVNVAQEILNLRKQNTDMVQLLYNNGQESKGNLMLSKAQTKLAQEAVDQNKRRLRLAQIQLDQLLGKDGFTQVAVQGSLDLPAPPKGYPDMASLVENNPNVQLQKAIWLGAKAGVGQSLSAMLPNVGVSYTRSTLGNTMIATQSPSWSFFGSVDIPIFSNGPLGTFFTLVSAKKTADQNEEQLRSTRLLTRATMENAWYNLKNEAQLVDVWDYRVKATKQRNDESTIRYSAGLMTYDTWEIAVTDLVNAEQTLINDQYLEAQYLAAWEQSKGLGLEDE